MPDDKHWDVFLSYSSCDQLEVEKLALRLEDGAHLSVFLDKWRISPGQPFIPELERAIRASRSCAVFLGAGEARPWQNAEMQAALRRAVSQPSPKDEVPFRVIPVLLPGAADPADDTFPSFIMTRSLVDFRSGKGLDNDEQFSRLVAGIRGVAPGKPETMPSWLMVIDVPDLKRPTGVTVDGRTVFVADHETGTIVRLDDDRVVKRQGGLLKPHHLVVMRDTLIATDTHHNELVFYDLDLEMKSRKDSFDAYHLRRPHGLASNYPEEFYVTDADNHRVLQVRAGDVVAAVGRPGCRSGFDIGEFSVPCGVAASLDCVYVADTYNHRIQVLTRDLRALFTFGTLGYGAGQFAYPVAVASWHNWIVISDEHNKRLQLWRREAGELPFGVTCVSSDVCRRWLGSPFGLAFDEDGRLYVADRKDGKVLRITFDKLIAASEPQ
jgi:DNA-binding beta-propeller fold protein YncE